MEFDAGEKDPKDGQILPQEKQVVVSPIHEDVHPEDKEQTVERTKQDGLVPTPFVETENTADFSQLDSSESPAATVVAPSSAHVSSDEIPFHWGAAIGAAAVCTVAGAILLFVWLHR